MRKTLVTIAVALSCLTMTANNLKVIYLTSEEAAFELSKVQYIDFRDKENFKIVGKDGNVLNTSAYNKTRVIDFKGTPTDVSAATSADVKVYPNPTQELLFVSGAENGNYIQVLDMQGRCVYNAQTSDETVEIPVANFNNGTYLLKVGNKILKFIKD